MTSGSKYKKNEPSLPKVKKKRSQNVTGLLDERLAWKGEISRVYESATTLEDLCDVLNSLSYLSINEVYRLEVIQDFFQALQAVEPSDVSNSLKCLPGVAEQLVRNLNHPNSSSLLADLSSLKQAL